MKVIELEAKAFVAAASGDGVAKPPGPPIFDTAKRIIGLTGRARSGKDTVADMICATFKPAERVTFAKPLKDGLKVMLNLTDEHIGGSLKEVVLADFGSSPRQMMQTLGTDWGREMVDQNIWLTVAKRKAEAAIDEGKHVVFTDVRFENEADMVRSLGGTVWHIVRDNARKVNQHASEAGVTNVPGDVVIYNNGTLEQLFEEVCVTTFKGVV